MRIKPVQQAIPAICLALALPMAMAQAPQSDTPSDYSHALPLSVSGKQAVVQLRLPKDVYLHARTADLRDLRVFDAEGHKLAFSLQESQGRSETSRRELPVRMFAVQTARDAGVALDADLEVHRSPDGNVLSVTARSRPAASNSSSSTPDTLVLDLGANAAPVDALRFKLPPGIASYQARVVLEVSDDLKQWDTVGDSAIAWLVNDATDTLASDRMEFEARAFRYARLSWREGKPLKFAAVIAEAPLSTAVAAPVERLVIAAAPGRFANDYVYPASVAIPVQRLGLELGSGNVVLPAHIGRYVELPDRHGGKTPTWVFEPVASATFYQLDQNGKRRASGDIAITPAHAAQWVVRTENAAGTAPALRLAWAPSTMVFLANGKPPYRLVFGRADAKSGESALRQVAPGFTSAEVMALESASAGALQVQSAATASGGPGAVEQAAASARLRVYALWAALLAGVGVLAFMAWRLIKQMK